MENQLKINFHSKEKDDQQPWKRHILRNFDRKNHY